MVISATADAYALPFAEGSFDLVWCAQSFITLDDPVRALREMARVVRTGGRVLVLETDEYHHVLLPWPVELELAVFRAVRAESRVRYGTGGKFAQARGLRSTFLEAGLTPTTRHTVVADRAAPFAPADREFLTQHLRYLREFVRPELTPRELELLDRAVDPARRTACSTCRPANSTVWRRSVRRSRARPTPGWRSEALSGLPAKHLGDVMSDASPIVIPLSFGS